MKSDNSEHEQNPTAFWHLQTVHFSSPSQWAALRAGGQAQAGFLWQRVTPCAPKMQRIAEAPLAAGTCKPSPAPVNSRAAAIHTAAFSSLHFHILGFLWVFNASFSYSFYFWLPQYFWRRWWILLLWKLSSTSQDPTARQHRPDILMTIAFHQLHYQYEFYPFFVSCSGTQQQKILWLAFPLAYLLGTPKEIFTSSKSTGTDSQRSRESSVI